MEGLWGATAERGPAVGRPMSRTSPDLVFRSLKKL